MSKYKKGDRFEFEIEEVYTDCLDSDFYKIKNITGIYSEGQLDMLKQVKPQTSKYDCNKALDYYHEQIRMCDYYDDCGGCPLRTSADFCAHSSSQTRIDAVQAWSDSHPEEAPKHEKTLKEDFFEKFPNAQRDPNGIPRSNPCDIYGENVKCSDFDCGSGECWNIPLSEVQKNEQRQEAKKELTAKEGNATALQIKSLKNVLKKLRDADPTKEEMITKIAVETEGFTVISKTDCEAIIEKITAMLEGGAE